MRCYIFDIDGTLADNGHREHHLQKDPKDWTSFFAACDVDPPISHIFTLAQDLARTGVAIVYVSGRSDECREATEAWLFRYGAPHGPVLMRMAGDHRNDDVLKPELLLRLQGMGYEPVMAFDDRKRVVAAWRAAGVPCAQVAEGDF
jgi:phosphoglycolate phosphatase-like HAD superfamily hydrolase